MESYMNVNDVKVGTYVMSYTYWSNPKIIPQKDCTRMDQILTRIALCFLGKFGLRIATLIKKNI